MSYAQVRRIYRGSGRLWGRASDRGKAGPGPGGDGLRTVGVLGTQAHRGLGRPVGDQSRWSAAPDFTAEISARGVSTESLTWVALSVVEPMQARPWSSSPKRKQFAPSLQNASSQ